MDIKHIGVIMDGNRRWARAHAFELYKGHDSGAKVFGDLCEWCLEAGVPFLTVYAFSTENWTRNEKEVRHLFALMEKYFMEEKASCVQKGIRIKVIGDRTRFDARALGVIESIENATVNCTRLVVQIALSYGGRDEIVRAAKKIAAHTNADGITEETFANYLDTAGTPDIDLVIRTGGYENTRLSNFLLWQTAYAELYFSNLLWPDFSREEFDRALRHYKLASRKKGK